MELTKEYLLGAINARNDAAINALLGLYARQTSDEQNAQTTSHQNGMGFNGLDADILSSFAEQVIRKRERGARPGTELSEKQLALLRKKLARYSRQLIEIAEEKQAAKAAKAATSPEKGEERPACGYCVECGKPADYRTTETARCYSCGSDPSETGPLGYLPSGYIAEGNGWRVKTAKDFYNEGYRLNLDSQRQPRAPAPTLEPASDFERCFMDA